MIPIDASFILHLLNIWWQKHRICLKSSLTAIKLLVKHLAAYFISMFYLFIYIYLSNYTILELNNYYYNNNYIINPYYNFLNIGISLDFFGLILLMIAYFAGLLSFLALDNKLYWKNIKHMFYLNIFVLIVFFYVSTNNILVLFIFYEFLLIPSF
jgi:formate hydrogenlyase subunit 3/multisubunit Na+/H+ antiporter MnhD subunit